ncbi:hypothetical protein Pint_18698 [Pistacia integerrima]|uniref:Uncharacterized protein n=1 Tax=Pistacia integerrima TaxID=434235 RepID=A0ACC0YX54_9ROSI|nr:hypothetical protein Pint_18698 [Pistacia integerrima]
MWIFHKQPRVGRKYLRKRFLLKTDLFDFRFWFDQLIGIVTI